MPKLEAINLAPQEAVEYFKSKGYHFGFDWKDTVSPLHARSFTVSKATELSVLEDIREATELAIAEGITFSQFQKILEPKLRAKGWWGRQKRFDPLTGVEQVVQLGSAHRLRIIFDTNLSTAYAAGRWERIQRVKERMPYLRYDAVQDSRTRDDHAAWHGVVLPVDHPFWQTHYPPNGWRCRCTVQQYSQEMLDQFGYQITDESRVRNYGQKFEWMNKRTGEKLQIPRGIDPGFSLNAGTTDAARTAQDLLLGKLDNSPPLVERASIDKMTDSRLFLRFAKEGSRAAGKAAARTGEAWPVAAISKDRIKEMGFDRKTSTVVRLSADTVDSHLKRFSEFTLQDWKRVQKIVDEGEWGRNRPRHRSFWIEQDGKSWRLVIKHTGHNEIFITTYHQVRQRNVRRNVARLRKE